jgi:site-specific DNA-cytosine methylase
MTNADGEILRVGCLPNEKGELKNNQSKRIYSVEAKARALTACAASGGSSDVSSPHTGLYAVPVKIGEAEGASGKNAQGYRVYAPQGKSVCLSAEGSAAGGKTGLYAAPVRVGSIENTAARPDYDSKPYRVYSPEGKAVTIQGEAGGLGAKTGLYSIPANQPERRLPVYRVEAGRIEIKGTPYPIKLPDGLYIIRKLTVTECCRLQTLPDGYCRAVSATQAYRGLGNGWTAEVITHLLSHALRGVPKDEEILVLSMYDGIGTGRYCFDKLGYKNISYHAYEIDKYAMRVAQSNYPDIIQRGDAFAVREDGWVPPVFSSERNQKAVAREILFQ